MAGGVGLITALALGGGLARVEGRPFRDHGFRLRGAATACLHGAGLGAAVLGLVTLGLMGSGGLSVAAVQVPILRFVGGGLAWALASLLVAASQECVFRGWVLWRLSGRLGFPIAAMITSLVFAAIHLVQPGASVVSLLTLFVFGLLMAMWTRAQGALWGAIAFHAAWDWVLIFVNGGGGRMSGDSGLVWRDEGAHLLTGGSAGLEGSLLTLAALLAFAAWTWRRGETSR